ncbi:hypothetical protein L596_027709 [Steinernema carpocapsae]|uniref:IGFBP N-terminal domain-containing protein n=1 Tax=Steinernema carpocapsae TaxID=34508 RepID=A0A4U5LWA9_STECR|nr:hypothetical protein L596_027709 [Steinernema carpocapsae]
MISSSNAAVVFFLATVLLSYASSLEPVDRVLDAFSLDLLDSTNRPEGCPPCTDSCPPLNGCPNRAFDGCACCELCVRSVNSSCGPGTGVCDKGLHCEPVTSEKPFSGICKGDYYANTAQGRLLQAQLKCSAARINTYLEEAESCELLLFICRRGRSENDLYMYLLYVGSSLAPEACDQLLRSDPGQLSEVVSGNWPETRRGDRYHRSLFAR